MPSLTSWGQRPTVRSHPRPTAPEKLSSGQSSAPSRPPTLSSNPQPLFQPCGCCCLSSSGPLQVFKLLGLSCCGSGGQAPRGWRADLLWPWGQGPSPGRLGWRLLFVGGLRVNCSPGTGTNAGSHHSIRLYFLPLRGKSVTRRSLFPAPAFREGWVCDGACAPLGLLAELFPFETQGRLEVGNVGPWLSHAAGLGQPRPQGWVSLWSLGSLCAGAPRGGGRVTVRP